MIMRGLSCFLVLTSCWLFAQEYRSTVSGLVTDPQGAAVSNARIVLLGRTTGTRFVTESLATGQYTIPLVPPGQFELTAEAPSFKKFVREGVTVSTNQRVDLDITLELGSLTEVVSITAEAPLVSTTTASVGQVITTNQVENMPMN